MPRYARATLGLLALFSVSATVPAAQTTPPLQVFAVIYSRGPAWTSDAAAFAHPAVKEHGQYFRSLGDRLIAAAPFVLDPKDSTVGMVLLLNESAESVRAWALADPALKAQVMNNTVYQWRVANVRPYKAGRSGR